MDVVDNIRSECSKIMEDLFLATVKHGVTEICGPISVMLGSRVTGIFAAWNWDGKELRLENDRYGLYPIYYYLDNGKIGVSPSIAKLVELAGDDLEFDDEAISVLIRLGWVTGEDTPFSKIRSLPPGSVLTWREGKHSIHTDGIIYSKPILISRSKAVQTYAELFQRSVEKSLPSDGRMVVPLSGGRDSRHIVFSIVKAGRKPDACITLLHQPPFPNGDARVAAEICQRLGIEHNIIEQGDSRFENEVEKNRITGYCAQEHGWFMPMVKRLNDDRCSLFDGIGGDVMSAGLFLDSEKLDMFRKNDLRTVAELIIGTEGYLNSLLSKKSSKRFHREIALNHLIAELDKHSDQPNPVGSFYFWNRTRRCIALSPFRLLSNITRILTPYLETDLWNFLSSLPAELMLDHRLHSDTISQAFPEYADIAYETKHAATVYDQAEFKRLRQEILGYSRTARQRKFVSRSFLISRFIRAEIQARYSRDFADFGPLAIHLLQMERL